LRNITTECQLIGEKNRIEQRRLGPLRQVLVVFDIRQRSRRRGGMPPRRLVVAPAVDEEVQV